MTDSLRIKTFAKVNLYLEILGRRSNGYHEIESVMQSVTLADEVELEPRVSGLEVTCDAAGVPTDETNLVAKAWEQFRLVTGWPDGLRVRILKKIPVAAGLGGGSANAAGVLAGLARMWGKRVDLAPLADEIGSDVPFFLKGGTQRARGRGTELTVLQPVPDCWVVLACPELCVSTPWAYSRVKLPLTRERDFLTMIESGLSHGDVSAVARGLYNRFESVVFGAYPALCSLKAEIFGRGALGVILSGSGPTLLSIFDGHESASALAAWLTEQGYRSYLAKPARHGVEIQ